MPAAPIVIDALRPRDWRHLVRAAILLNVGAGDYFDVGARAITLWAGPENKPAGWPPDVPITAGDRPQPRAFVGAITYDWPGGQVDWTSTHTYPVLLTIRISEVAAWRQATAPRAWPPHDPDLARVVDDEAWCRRQWSRLKQFAEVGGAR